MKRFIALCLCAALLAAAPGCAPIGQKTSSQESSPLPPSSEGVPFSQEPDSEESSQPPEEVLPTPEELKAIYQTALDQSNALASVDITTNARLTGRKDGADFNQYTDIDLQYKKTGDEDAVFSADIAYNTLDDSFHIPVYCADGYAYIDFSGRKTKVKSDAEEIEELLCFQPGFLEIQPDIFKKLSKMETVGDTTVYTFTNKMEKTEGLMESVPPVLWQQIYTLTHASMLGRVEGSFTVDKNGYLVSQTFQVKVMFMQNDIVLNFEGVATTTLHRPGEAVSIAAPNFSEYTRTTEDAATVLGIPKTEDSDF